MDGMTLPFVARLRGTLIDTYLAGGPLFARTAQMLGRALGRDPRRVTFYHQVDDPWSHLLAQVLPRLLEAYPVSLEVQVVPAPTADADPEPERRRLHARRDAALLAGLYGLDLPQSDTAVWPPPELTRRANALLACPRAGADALRVVGLVGDALWRGDEVAMSAAEQELTPVGLEEVAPALEAGRNRLRRAGHYQGGMLHYGGLWYWGVDRLHYLEARLQREGLPEAAPLLVRVSEPDLPALRRTEGRIGLEFYFSFRSPYSYVALDRTLALVERFDLDLRIRPVLPMVMRGLPVPRAKRLYLVKDAKREADRLGIPFGRICDPLGAGVERCLAICALAESRGCLGAFLQSAGRGIWSEALDMATDTDLRTVVTRAGLDWDEVVSALADPGWRAQAEANREALLALDMWGVPSYQLGTTRVWGQDRIALLEAILRRTARGVAPDSPRSGARAGRPEL